MTQATPDALARASERAARAGDELDEAVLAADYLPAETSAVELAEPGVLERAAVAQAHALVAIAGYLGALVDMALVALSEPRA